MAVLSGIPVARLKTGAYVASALLATLAGVFFAGFIGYVDRFVGRGTDIDSIAAALIGGTAFSGGRARSCGRRRRPAQLVAVLT